MFFQQPVYRMRPYKNKGQQNVKEHRRAAELAIKVPKFFTLVLPM